MAKRMVLVDEREYELFKAWKPQQDTTTDLLKKILDGQQTSTTISKSYLSGKLHSQLDSNEKPDDVAAKDYQRLLHRYLNLKQQVPDLQPTALNGLIVEPKRKLKPVASRHSQRKHVRWNRFDD